MVQGTGGCGLVCVCRIVGQITGHLWHHYAGFWASIRWLELALSLCFCHTLTLRSVAPRRPYIRHCP
jgi:hypothetical protein